MRPQKREKYKLVSTIAIYLLIVCISISVAAKTHTILFGGSAGFAFSPNTFTAAIGDTVQWSGPFSVHPLSSTVIPGNASPWHNSSGTTFLYVIKVPGDYSYKCDIHTGMNGSFTVVAAAVKSHGAAIIEEKVLDFSLLTAHGKRILLVTIPKSEYVTATLFTLSGKSGGLIINSYMHQGAHEIQLVDIPSGMYELNIKAGRQQVAKTISISH